MTDAEYIFKQTEIERKKNGYGDKHKKRQGGKTVRFPSDYMTRREREAMSGEVITYKEKPFYSREEFQKLPDDLRLKWVNSIINRYGVALYGVSRIIFGQRDWLTNRVDLQYVNKGPHGQAAAKGNRKLEADFKAYIDEQNLASKPQELEEVKVQAEEAEKPAEAVLEAEEKPKEEPAKMDVYRIATLMAALCGTGAKVTIEVTL